MSTATHLSAKHRATLEVESGIAPEIATERGYRTVRSRAELPPEFKSYQRRPGLLVPMYSPDGETVNYQLRPDKPRKGGPKYETPGGISPVVDVHPRMLEEARHGDGPLLITEGAKTGDAATSRGICTVVLAGVWMWCVPKVKPYRLKPCFDHIRLDGREVFVAFDSDCMSKANVQDALAALVAVAHGEGVNKVYSVSIASLETLRDRRTSSGSSGARYRESSPAEHRSGSSPEHMADVIRELAGRLETRAASEAELRTRLELTAQAESTLREQLAREQERADRLEAELWEARNPTPAASPEPRDAPETATEPGAGTSPPASATDEPRAERRASWWRRFFGFE